MLLASDKALEFNAIRLLLAQVASSEMGRDLAMAVGPLEDEPAVLEAQRRVAAIRRLRAEGAEPSMSAFSRLAAATPKLRFETPVLEPGRLHDIAAALLEASANRQLLESESEELPALAPLAASLEMNASAAEEILDSIDAGGEILDCASPHLQNLRASYRTSRAKIYGLLQRFFDPTEHRDYVQDDFVTIRGGRLVIPIKIEHRNKHRGIVHDRSRGGDSLFFEPLEAVELNNSLAEIQSEIDLEEARILARLTSGLYEQWADVTRVLGAMAELDLLGAKAALAELYRGVEPSFVDGDQLEIRDARHPLLDERLAGLRTEAGISTPAEGDHPVVPMHIRLNERSRVLIVTGPNAGGKTVALKTAGLLAVMAQSGMQVPAREYAAPVFRTISADIGDYQDIISHLSSFSSHLVSLKRLFREIRMPALVLLDEIASATDPGEGSALAMAVLENLRDRGALVLASTHLEALKIFAQAQAGMENASLEFDPRTMRPTYELIYGIPGSSNAMETAVEIGLPGEIIARAREYLGDAGGAMREVVSDLRRELAEAREQRKRLEEDQRALDKARRQYVQRLEAAREKEQRLLKRIEAEWLEFKRAREASAAQALEKIKSAPTQQAAKAAAREESRKLKEDFDALALHRRRREAPPADDGGSLAAGEEVELPGFGKRGVVLQDWLAGADQEVVVSIGGMRLRVRRGAVARAARAEPEEKSKPGGGGVQIIGDDREARSELNVIGKKVDEALSLAERFLDEALMKGLGAVRIIHGRGTGALRRAIAEHLSKQPYVTSWHPAEPPAGGEGVTVVELAK